jgi:hypothetical protein
MRKILFRVGIVFVLFIFVVLGVATWFMHANSQIDKEARPYADAAIVAITKDWNDKELIQRASSNLLKQVKPEDLDSMFAWFGTLGPLADFDGAKLVRWTKFSGTGGTVTSAEYSGVAKYREGTATITIDIQKTADTWQVNGFRVNSSKLLENKVGKGA